MIKIVTLSVLLALTPFASAGEFVTQKGKVFKTTNTSIEAQLCLAALDSEAALERKARELKIKRRELRSLSCNGMPVIDFAEANRNSMPVRSIATVQ